MLGSFKLRWRVGVRTVSEVKGGFESDLGSSEDVEVFALTFCSGSGGAVFTLRRRAGRVDLVGDSSEIFISLKVSLMERDFFRGDSTSTPASSWVTQSE